jgi:cell division transport system permease protein
MRTWLREHALAVSDTLGRMGRSPVGTLLSILVIGIALALPAGLHVLLKNLATLAPERSAEPELTLYLQPDLAEPDRKGLESRLAGQGGVSKVRFVPRDVALKELEKATGMTSIQEEVGRNPLPDAFVVAGRRGAADALEKLRAEAGQWPGVEHAQLDSAWARQVDSALRAGRVFILMLAGVLVVGLGAVTFNTIRLQILNRREEIEVSKLIGATNAFIRRPFLYFGAIQAVAGALLSWLLVELAVGALETQLGQGASLLSPGESLMRLSLLDLVGAGLIAALVGWIGAWLSVAFHLRRLDPT